MIDDRDEELERRTAAKLLGRDVRKSTVVETRRSGKPKKPVPVVEVSATPIPLERGGLDSHVVTFTSVLPDGRRIPLKTIRAYDTSHPRDLIKEYESDGRTVRWVGANPEELPD